jgi:hypothetical protein
MKTDAVLSFLIQHQSILLGLVFWPLITALMNVMLRRKSAEAWEIWAMGKPGLAFLIEVSRAAGFDPAKLLIAFQRYAQRRSGVIPEDAVRSSKLPPLLQKALLNPEMVKVLSVHLEKSESAAVAAPVQAADADAEIPPTETPVEPPAAAG